MAQKILDGLQSKNQYQYTKDILVNSATGEREKIFFNTYQIYNRSVDQSGVIDQGTVQTFQLVNKGGTWYKGAQLKEDGKWYALSEKESGIYVFPSDTTKPGTFKPIPNATDNLVLGSSVIRDLNEPGRDSLRYQAINNAKFQLKKAGGLTNEQVDREFDISNNIAPPGKPGTPGLFGPAVKPDDKTELTTIETGETQLTSDTPQTLTSSELQELPNIEIKSRGTVKSNYGNMRYPNDMSDMDCVVFTARKYGARGFNENLTGFEDIKKRRIGEVLGTAALSIQPSLRDTNTVKWSGLEMSVFDTALADLSLSTATGGASGARGFIDRAMGTIQGEGENLKNAILTKIAESAASTQGLLPRLTGAIFNPNLELLFQGPELRTFNFNFNLSPRESVEASQVKKIINFFKRNMSVQRSDTALFLKAPNVFDIEYKFSGDKQIHPSLNKIKTCALVSCSVDYTPSNSYMTFDDGLGTPVQYTLSMTFQELEPVFEDEYEGHDIGY
jgi:hypothetical protein